jgi:protocatechuate 3,4-dioxygenase beta subunit
MSSNWLPKWFPRRTRTSARIARSYRPRFEMLEDRLTPAVFNVAPGDVPGLVTAINTANINSQPDDIYLAPGAVYDLISPADLLFGSTGLPGILLDGSAANTVTIHGNGATIQRDAAAPAFRLILVNGGSLELDNLTLANGTSAIIGPLGGGGGVRVQGGSLTLDSSTLVGNIAAPGLGNNGGGVSVGLGASATITNSTFDGNQGNLGGGLDVGGNVTVQSSTFTGNTASAVGGGIFVELGGSLALSNTLVAGNSGAASPDVAGPVNPFSSYNLIGDGTGLGGITNGVNGNLIGTTADPIDPKLGVLGYNGGPTPTVALLPGSPAIDAGTPAPAAPTDQRGYNRPSGITSDIGAYEVQQPFSLIASGGSGQSTTVATPFASPLQATLLDAAGRPLSGVLVSFSTPGSGAGATFTPVGQAITDPQGHATLPASANTVAGSYTVVAAVPSLGVSTTFALTNTPGSPAAVTAFAGAPQSTPVGADYASPLQARVTDVYGNPVPGVAVAFAAPSSGPTGTFAAGGIVTTDASGIATAPALTAGTVAGTFTATASTDGVESPANFTLTNLAGPATTITATSGGGQSTTVNTPFSNPLVVTVTDADGNPVSGTTVTFTNPDGGVFFTAGNSVVTDAGGHASVPVFAGTVAGTSTVNATVAGVNTPATFTLTETAGNPVYITAQSGDNQSATVNTPFADPLVARVTDIFGNPVSGVSVTFGAPASGPSADFGVSVIPLTLPPGSAQPAISPFFGHSISVMTDADGLATVPEFTANTHAGAYTVTATTTGGAATSFHLTNTAGAASHIDVVSGNNQTATVGTAFGQPLAARVTDTFGNPVSGVGVTFAAPTSGPSGDFAIVFMPLTSVPSNGQTTVTTDADGLATAPMFTANTVAGAYTVTATAAGVELPASFNLTNTPGEATSVAFTSGGGQSATVGTAFTNPLVVTVTDANGNPVPGVMVTFTGPTTGAGVTFVGGNTAVTDASGHAVKNVTATTTAGSFTVTASAAGQSPSSVTLTNLPGAPAAVTVVGGGDQSAAVQTGFAHPVQVRVTDAFGNPVPGASVAFSVPSSGATASFQGDATVQTDANGLATSPSLVANDTAGAFAVTATVSGAPAATAQLTNTVALAPPSIVVGQDEGGNSQAALYDPKTGSQQAAFNPFGTAFTGGVRVASADFNGDGVADVVVGTGPGVGTQVQVLDGTDRHVLFTVSPFEASFTGGVFVAVGDITGDGKPDLVVTPGEGGGPVAVVYDGAKLVAGRSADDAQVIRFLGIDDPNFRGGARASVGDFNADGSGDLIVAAGFGGGPRVAGFDGKSLVAGTPARLFADFFVFEQSLRNGVYVAAGDLTGDGDADLVVGGGPGGGPRVMALSGADLLSNTQTQVANFFAGDTANRGGIRVAVRDLDGDGRADLATGSGAGGGSRVTVYTGQSVASDASPTELESFDAIPGFAGGVFVG